MNGTKVEKVSIGGGSGGSIFVMTYYLKGNGTFSIQGGSSIGGNGGAGSGGRLRLLRFDWRDYKYFTPQGIYEAEKKKDPNKIQSEITKFMNNTHNRTANRF